MTYRVLADVVLVVHLSFIVFVVAGGLFFLRWRVVAWIHIPAVVWAVLLEFMGWICPLTPLENWLRAQAGDPGYGSGFIEHFLLPLVYPTILTRDLQVALGTSALILNAAIYAWAIHRRARAVAERGSR
jgi:hypothetical protein